MKRQLACLGLMIAATALSGCYYDPGYTYVRGSGYGGDAYYGSTYYAAPYYDGYYPGYYGCCYAPGVSIGVSGRWYGGSRYRGYRHGRYDDHRGYRGRGYQHGGRDGRSGNRDSRRGRGDHHH